MRFDLKSPSTVEAIIISVGNPTDNQTSFLPAPYPFHSPHRRENSQKMNYNLCVFTSSTGFYYFQESSTYWNKTKENLCSLEIYSFSKNKLSNWTMSAGVCIYFSWIFLSFDSQWFLRKNKEKLCRLCRNLQAYKNAYRISSMWKLSNIFLCRNWNAKPK